MREHSRSDWSHCKPINFPECLLKNWPCLLRKQFLGPLSDGFISIFFFLNISGALVGTFLFCYSFWSRLHWAVIEVIFLYRYRPAWWSPPFNYSFIPYQPPVSMTPYYHTLQDRIINFYFWWSIGQKAHLMLIYIPAEGLITASLWSVSLSKQKGWEWSRVFTVEGLTICYHNNGEILNLNCLFDLLIHNVCMYYQWMWWSWFQ